MRRVKGGMEGESWKSSGGRTRLYSWPMTDEARSDTIPGRGE
jgi:hypothetical protein